MKAKLEDRNAQSAEHVAALFTDATIVANAAGLGGLGDAAATGHAPATATATATCVGVGGERRWASITSQLQTTYLSGVQAFDISLSWNAV